ncbi:MAG: valine--tRNA ligase [Actinomycetota bacterium]|nr:valine--tRNA ligase [Actinomycetota bacterium]
MSYSVPEKPTLDGLEANWSAVWDERHTYAFDPADEGRPIYAIDTPPPTVSGSLHAGHVLSYTHTDIIARFKRMRGHNVFYPMGWDDNGLPTERRVQNYYGITCDPSIPFVPNFVPTPKPDSKERHAPVSRTNFIAACQKLTAEDEQAFENLWRTLGLSVDWDRTYTTIGQRSQRVSQLSFVRLFRTGHLYHAESPTLWDVDFQTAVSQAELEDRETDGEFFSIAFELADGTGKLEIQSTRPELLPACVALVAHPEDKRYSQFFGKSAVTPLFGIEVPILAHPLADPEKGSGMAMVCTFGDMTDVQWWRDLELPTRSIIDRYDRLVPVDFTSERFPSRDPESAAECYEEMSAKSVRQARKAIATLLEERRCFLAEPRRIRHAVKYYEKGDKPLEVVTSWQWYIRTLNHKDLLLRLGEELNWIPPFMKVRYDNWVRGLASDWNISRQRYFGIPIPVWYPIDEDGNVDRQNPIIPDDDELPIDPFQDTPAGYDPGQRGEPGGFVGDSDVMDTWATSSLTPQIATGWEEDPELFARLFPMDLRPQGQDIIRTWLFYTVLRSALSQGELPWRNTVISGFVLDPDRKKMSKSKGNVVTPMPLIEKHGADSLRYWAASGRPGVDTAADENTMRVGRRLAIKILNASKFALSIASGEPPADLERQIALTALDAALLEQLKKTVAQATAALEEYDHTRALEVVESFFWSFCDDYLELVKLRAYGEHVGTVDFSFADTMSARVTLTTAVRVVLRLFAPFLPFVTEEVWSWFQPGSIHLAEWPSEHSVFTEAQHLFAELVPGSTLLTGLTEGFDSEAAYLVLSRVRRAKTEAKTSMKTPVAKLRVTGNQEVVSQVAQAKVDLLCATGARDIQLLMDPTQDATLVEVELEL